MAKADTAGAPSFAGGNFPATSNNRYLVREARLKFVYGNDLNLFQVNLMFQKKDCQRKMCI